MNVNYSISQVNQLSINLQCTAGYDHVVPVIGRSDYNKLVGTENKCEKTQYISIIL